MTPRVAGIVAPRIDHWWTKPSIHDPEHIRVADTRPFLMAKASTFLSVGVLDTVLKVGPFTKEHIFANGGFFSKSNIHERMKAHNYTRDDSVAKLRRWKNVELLTVLPDNRFHSYGDMLYSMLVMVTTLSFQERQEAPAVAVPHNPTLLVSVVSTGSKVCASPRSRLTRVGILTVHL